MWIKPVLFLLILFNFIGVQADPTAQTDKNCSPGEECEKKEACPYVQEKYQELQGLNRGHEKRRAIVQELKAAICNKKENTFCCPKTGNIRAGNFENHKYDGTPTKNRWHYVTIERIGQNYKWSNKAGVSWTLYPTDDPNSLRVGEDSPYYADGHRTALFTDKGVYGPGDELYDLEDDPNSLRVGEDSPYYADDHRTALFTDKGVYGPGDDEFYDLEEHCPIGWTSLSTGCYMFNRASDGQTYQEAKNFCRGKGGYLVKIDDQEEQDALWQFCQDNQLDKRVAWWLGATDSDEEGEWKWDYTGEIFFKNGQSLRYNAFYPGGGGLPAEPNNNKNEDCLAADSDSRAFKWNDLQCTWKTWTWRKLKALCEYPVSKVLFSDPVDACLQYLNNEIITGITLEECKEKCSSATSFICHSLDYERSVSRCFLSEDSKKTQPSAYKEPCYDGTDSTYLEQIFTE